jgi:NAD(P)H-nitrite reductase large subunit
MMDKLKLNYVIIGNSAGGIGAAEAIRTVDCVNNIGIISDEPYPAYSRPLISEYLAHPCPTDRLLFRKPDFYDENNIQPLLGEKVTSIDTLAHSVTLAGGRVIGYGKLLIASGGTPIVPDTEGSGLQGVFTFNRLDDAIKIDRWLSRYGSKVRVAVIGGGLIGVSVTEALVKRGAEVTVIEMKDRVLNTILDAEASALEARALEKVGVAVITGHTAINISGHLHGEVDSLTLDDGRIVKCEMVIFAIGVRPRLELAVSAGLKVNRGVIVDRNMRTSAPDIYACGDCAEAYDFIHGENRLTPVWPNAYEGGYTAGLNMAGQFTKYGGGVAMNALKYFGLNIVSAGLAVAPDNGYETIISRKNNIYRKVILRDGKLAGIIYAGDIEKSGIVYNLIKDRVDVTGFKNTLIADDFGLASLPENIWRAKLAKLPVTSVPATCAPTEADVELAGFTGD